MRLGPGRDGGGYVGGVAEERLTRKGVRQREAILEAAVRLLGREGYAAASLARIAEEAGVSKRAVLYYFGTREDLFVQVAARVGDRLLEQVAIELESAEDLAVDEAVGHAFDRLWHAITTDRALVVAYFGLVAESVVSPAAAVATGQITGGMRELAREVLAHRFSDERDGALDGETFLIMLAAGVQGLTLELLERGPSPALDRAVLAFRAWLVHHVRPR